VCGKADGGAQVCVRGENVTAGYLDRPEANAESFQKGWFRTGDNGYLDKDGYLFLTGRLKEIVNRGGEKISPIEIDAILLEHPLVAEGVAFGLPSEKYGEVLACCVVPAPGASLTPENVVDYLAKKVSREKVPAAKHVFIGALPRPQRPGSGAGADRPRTVKEIPKSNIGKVQRRNLAAVFNSKL
jgi:acyl-CoA synthetase (AMP-forming)/AMP-acid ligase II